MTLHKMASIVILTFWLIILVLQYRLNKSRDSLDSATSIMMQQNSVIERQTKIIGEYIKKCGILQPSNTMKGE